MLLRDTLILEAACAAGGFAIAGQALFAASITLLFKRNASEASDFFSSGLFCSEWDLVSPNNVIITISLFRETSVTGVCWSFRAPTSPSLLIASATWLFLRLNFEKLAFWFIAILFRDELLRFRGLIHASAAVP